MTVPPLRGGDRKRRLAVTLGLFQSHGSSTPTAALT